MSRLVAVKKAHLKSFTDPSLHRALSCEASDMSADMFESVNKKTLIHPLYKVGFFNSKRTP